MKKILQFSILTLLLLVVRSASMGQVSISSDGSEPHPSAMLEIKSSGKGFLLPKVQLISLTSPAPILNPAIGLIVHNYSQPESTSGVRNGVYIWDGIRWRQMIVPAGQSPNELIYWDGQQLVSLGAGSPGQVLSIGPDSSLTWSYGCGGVNSPNVLTTNPSEIKQFSFKIGGNVVSDGGSAVTQRGICYSQTPNPNFFSQRITAGAGTGLFTVQVTGLTANTLYYAKAYAMNSVDTVYGDQVAVQTLPLAIPTLITMPAVTLSQSSVSTGGEVIGDGGSPVFFRGVCWDTIPAPDVNDLKTFDGSGLGNFVSQVNGLLLGKTYYIRAYAINNIGIAYGNEVQYSTTCATFPPASVSISANSLSVCAGASVTITATPVNGGSNPAYQWMVNGENMGVNNPEFTYPPANGDIVSCILTSSLACVSQNPAQSNALTFNVNPLLQPQILVYPSASSVCSGTPVTFMASQINGGGNPSYQWKVNNAAAGSNIAMFSYTPGNLDKVHCILTSNAQCVTSPTVSSDTITLNVSSQLPVSAVITTPLTSVCAGTSVTFTVATTNGGLDPDYQWRVNGNPAGTNAPQFTYVPINGEVVTCQVTSSESCATGNPATSNPITMTVHNVVTPFVAISSSANNVCAGTTVTFTANIINGGTNPQFQWKVNGQIVGTNSPTYSYIPLNGDQVSCDLTSSVACASPTQVPSNIITMAVNPMLPVSNFITPSENPVCSPQSVTLTATPSNGGSNPVYQWVLNGVPVGTNQPVYTYVPSNNDQIICNLTSSAVCPAPNPVASNMVVMSVIQPVQLSATISDPGPVCSGSQITLTATVVNGGTSPVYQWKKNGAPVGANSPSLTFVPVNGDNVGLTVTSSLQCVSGSPLLVPPVPVSVLPIPAPAVSVSPDFNPVCAGSTVVFTASLTDGGSSPAVQWKVNGNPVGNGGLQFSYTPANNDIVVCQMVSSLPCAPANPVVSAPVMMSVLPLNPLDVTITASENPVCAQQQVTFTAQVQNGGNSPLFQWLVNGVPTGTGSSSFSYQPVHNDQVKCIVSSGQACLTGNPATSNVLTMQVNPLLQPGVTITASSTSACNGSSVILEAIPVNGGANPQFIWRVNNNPIGPNSPFFSFTPSNGDVVSCTMIPSVACPTVPQVTSNSLTISVSQQVAVSLTIVPSVNPVCGSDNVTLTAIPINPGQDPVYQWVLNGAPVGTNLPVYSYVPTNNDQIICNLTSSVACPASNPVSSNMVTLSVSQPVQLSAEISNPGPVCAGSQTTINASVVNGGTNPVYEWKKNGIPVGFNSPSLTFIPVNGDNIGLIVTSSLGCVTGSPLTVPPIDINVLPVPSPSVSVIASSNPVCNGTSVTLMATLTDAGSTPTLQWKVNGSPAGNGSQQLIYTPSNNDVVVCELISSLPCAPASPVVSTPVLMTVLPVNALSVTISASENPVCDQQMVTFTAQVANGGSSPVYQWYVNNIVSGSGSSSFSYQPAAGDQVKCVVSSGLACLSGSPATSNSIVMQVNPLLTSAVSITASDTSVCSGTLVSFTANAENGGVNPQFEWTVNNNVRGTGQSFTYSPVNGDIVQCKMVSVLPCISGSPAFSNVIGMSVATPLVPSVTISASQTSICSGNPVTITAVPYNGGEAPVYQWFKNGSLVQSGPEFTYTFIPVNSVENVTCSMLSSETCVTGNPAQSTMIPVTVVNSLPASVSISASANNVCQGSQVTFTAFIDYGGSSPVVQWYVNDTIRGTNSNTFSYVPTNSDQVRCVLFSNAPCVSNNPVNSGTITMTVIPVVTLDASITVDNNPLCEQQEATFTTFVTNGGDNPVFEWFVNGISVGGGLSEYAFVPVDNNVVYCKVTSSLNCVTGSPATTNQIIMEVNPLLPVSVSISASSASVCSGESVTLTAVAVNGGSNPAFEWLVDDQVQQGFNSNQFTFIPADGNMVFCRVTSDEVCQTGSPAQSNTIQFTVNDKVDLAVGITASSNQVCEGAAVTFYATVSPPSVQVQYQWKVNGNMAGLNQGTFSYVPVMNDVITCEVQSSSQCLNNSQATSDPIVPDVIPVALVSIIISANQTVVCAGTPVTFSAQTENAGTSPLYQWKVNGYGMGENLPEFTYEPVDNDVITCTLTSDAVCADPLTVTSNPVTVDVNPNQVVDLQLTVSQNNICAGTDVQFSASAINGGNNPSYTWFVNGSVVPVSGSIYSYAPQNGDEIFCAVLSNEQCVVESSDTSNLITMVVNTVLTPVITITASENPVCEGGTVTYTAAVINGGPSPAYRWYVGGEFMGETSPVFSFEPLNGDQIYCELFSSDPCASNLSVPSNIISMTVLPLQPFSVQVTASSTVICAGTEVTFTAVVTNGGNSPQFNWTVEGISKGNQTDTFIYSPADGEKIWCTVTSSLPCAVDNPQQSNIVIISVNQPQLVSVTISSDQNNVCAGTQVSFSANPVNGGELPAYQWFVNDSPVGGNNSLFSFIPQHTDKVTCQLTSSGSCVSNNPATSLPVNMVVNPILPVSVSISPSSNPVCAGSSVSITALATNPGSGPLYLWYVNNIPQTETGSVLNYTPYDNDNVRCVLNSSSSCTSGNPASSETLTLDVYTNLYVGSVASSQILCADNQPATLVATPPSNGSNPVYQWQKSDNNIVFTDIPGATNLTYQPEIITDTMYYRQLQNADQTCGGPLPTNTVSVIMTPPALVSVEITMNVTGIIYQGSTVIFTASYLNGGTSPVFNWYVNGNIQENHTPQFTYTPSDGDQVYCILYSDQNCVTGTPATSNILTLTVSSDPLLPVAVSVTANPDEPVCSGSYVTFTAIPGNGGENPVYQWKVNGMIAGSNSQVFTYQPANGDVVTCTMTSSLPNVLNNPAVSEPITLETIPLSAVSNLIGASENPVCEGSAVTFAAIPFNGGSNPSYTWLVNNVITSTGSSAIYSYNPQDGDEVICLLNSSLSCVSGNPALSNTITMAVNPMSPVSVSVVPSANSVCAGTEVEFTAVQVNGGQSPQYQWKVNGISQGQNEATFSYIPVNSDVVSCVLTSDLACASGNPATSNPVVMTVFQPAPVSVTISVGQTSVCQGTLVTISATPVNAGNAPAYQWKLNGEVVGDNSSFFSFIPDNLDVVVCELTSSINCPSGNPAISNPLTFNVMPVLQVSSSITASANPVCSGTTVQFNASVVNGGASPSYLWKVNGTSTGATSALYSFIPANNDVVSCVVTSSLSCVSGNPANSNQIQMGVNPIVTMSASISASANNVCAGTPVTYTLTTQNAGSSLSIQWKVNGIPVGVSSNSFTYTPVHGDLVSCTVTSTASCLTSNTITSNSILMSVNPVVNVSVGVIPTANPVCQGTNVTFTANIANGGSAPVYLWKVNGLTVGSNLQTYTYSPLNNDQITCTLTSNAQCPDFSQVTSAPVTMSVIQALPVALTISASDNPACTGQTVIFTATAANPGSTPSYQWKVNGTNVGNGSTSYAYQPMTGDNVSCVLTSSANCATGNPATSNTITMSVVESLQASITITESANSVCAGSSVTFTSAVVNGGSAPVYQWKVNGSNVGSSTSSYTYAPQNGDIVVCKLFSNASCLVQDTVSSNAVTMTISPSVTVSVTISTSAFTVCAGTSVTCTANPLNGGPNPSFQWTLNNVNVGDNSPTFTFTPANSDKVRCKLTSSLNCFTSNSYAWSNIVGYTVNPVLTASISIAATPSGSVCQGNNVVFSATTTNPGTAPTYQWKVNGTNVSGATTTVYTYMPEPNDQVSCVMTSNATCVTGSPATSNTLQMTVNPSQAVSALVWASSYAVVSGTPVTYYAKSVNGGATPVYQWYVDNSLVASGSSSYTYTPTNNQNVKCLITSSLSGCLMNNPATSNIVNMIVYTTGTACASGATVVHYGRTYNTVQVGTQCWLRENLNVGTQIAGTLTQTNNSQIEKYCYGNDTLNCNVYGGLYQWAEAVQYLSGVTNTTHWNPLPTTPVKGLCPEGWHIPSKTEYETMFTYLGGTTVAGAKLKETGTVHWYSPNTGASNSSGFTMLPAGNLASGVFASSKTYANIWTVTKGNLADAAYYFGAAYNYSSPTTGQNYKINGLSIRCLKD